MRNFFTPLFFLAAAAVALAQTHEDPPSAPGTNAPAVPSAPQTVATAAAKPNAYRVPPFETYQPIIDRMPFGKVVAPPPPPPEQPVDNTQQEQEMQNLARLIRLQAIVRNPDGRTAAGFSDRSVNPEKNIYLAVGDTQDGFRLVAADYNEDTATIEKDGVTITIKLGAGMIPTVVNAPALNIPAPAATPQVGGRIRPTPAAQPAPPVPPLPSLPPAANSRFNPETPEHWPMPSDNLVAIDRMLEQGVDNSTYRERLQKRRQELVAERTQKEADHAKAIDDAAEERAAELFITMMRRKNLDMIREGGEGLGIPLTPEEDAMLTREGVLPGADDDDDE